MGNRKSHSERFLCLDKVANVGTAVITAGGTSAVLVEGTGISCVLLVEKVHLAVPGEQVSVTGVPGSDAYTATKGATLALTRSLAAEYGGPSSGLDSRRCCARVCPTDGYENQ